MSALLGTRPSGGLSKRLLHAAARAVRIPGHSARPGGSVNPPVAVRHRSANVGCQRPSGEGRLTLEWSGHGGSHQHECGE